LHLLLLEEDFLVVIVDVPLVFSLEMLNSLLLFFSVQESTTLIGVCF